MTLTRSIPTTLVTTHLEMTDRAQFQPDYADDMPASLRVVRMDKADVRFYRFLYDAVGDQWAWRDRRLMSDVELHNAIADPCVSVYVLYVDGVPAGYIELAKQGGSTEIVYLGLRPEYMGQGLGKYLLSMGIARAWDEGAQRVWVHTCNNDAPSALPNYLKRGFRVFRVDEESMPDRYKS
jgi:GNAT superfamily N-acetyltransferase